MGTSTVSAHCQETEPALICRFPCYSTHFASILPRQHAEFESPALVATNFLCEEMRCDRCELSIIPMTCAQVSTCGESEGKHGPSRSECLHRSESVILVSRGQTGDGESRSGEEG